MVWTAAGKVSDPFESAQRYGVIYADPPWSYRDRAESGRRGAAYKYPLLGDEDVARLPVEQIAADDAMLFLWVTWPKLPELLPIIEIWGFQYRTVAFVWVKRTRRSGVLAWGMGSWTRANTEPCLLATRGRPKRVSAGVHQVVEAPLARHSEKPAEVRDRIVQLAGDVPRIELFAREVHDGWNAWGNDVRTGEEPSGPSPVPTGQLPPRNSEAWRTHGRRLVDFIQAHGPRTRAELAEGLGLRPDFVKALLAKLVRRGSLAKRGRTRGMRYELTGDADRENGKDETIGQLPLRPRR